MDKIVIKHACDNLSLRLYYCGNIDCRHPPPVHRCLLAGCKVIIGMTQDDIFNKRIFYTDYQEINYYSNIESYINTNNVQIFQHLAKYPQKLNIICNIFQLSQNEVMKYKISRVHDYKYTTFVRKEYYDMLLTRGVPNNIKMLMSIIAIPNLYSACNIMALQDDYEAIITKVITNYPKSCMKLQEFPYRVVKLCVETDNILPLLHQDNDVLRCATQHDTQLCDHVMRLFAQPNNNTIKPPMARIVNGKLIMS